MGGYGELVRVGRWIGVGREGRWTGVGRVGGG